MNIPATPKRDLDVIMCLSLYVRCLSHKYRHKHIETRYGRGAVAYKGLGINGKKYKGLGINWGKNKGLGIIKKIRD